MAKVTLTRPLRKSSAYVKKIDEQDDKHLGSNHPTPHPTPIGGWGGGGFTQLNVGVEEKKKEEAKPCVSLESLLELANQLPASERKQLLARLALQAQTSDKGDDRDKDMWSCAVYDGLVSVVGGGVGGLGGPAVVKRVLTVPAAWGPISGFMASSRLDRLNVTERQSVYGLLAGLAIQRAQEMSRHASIPLSAKLVGTCSANMAGIFEQAFPGYLASGLAPLVAKQLVANKEILG